MKSMVEQALVELVVPGPHRQGGRSWCGLDTGSEGNPWSLLSPRWRQRTADWARGSGRRLARPSGRMSHSIRDWPPVGSAQQMSKMISFMSLLVARCLAHDLDHLPAEDLSWRQLCCVHSMHLTSTCWSCLTPRVGQLRCVDSSIPLALETPSWWKWSGTAVGSEGVGCTHQLGWLRWLILQWVWVNQPVMD